MKGDPRRRYPITLNLAILALAGGLAAGAVWYPLAAMAAAACLSAAVVARCSPRVVENLFLGLLLALLTGYALLGKTFAYIGVAPVFIGELVLGVGLLSAVTSGWHLRLVRTPSMYLLAGFMSWGAIRSIPYLGTYGLNVLRDAVVWGYGIFAFLVAPLLLRRQLVDRIPGLYARLLPWIIVCAPAYVVAWTWTGMGGLPGPAKAGDAAVHLGGAAAFLLTVGRNQGAAARGGSRWLPDWGAWPVLLVGMVAMGSLNRGGLVAAITAVLTVMILLPSRVGGKLVIAGATAVLIMTVWLGSGVSLPGSGERAISPEQIAKNLGSVGGGGGATADMQGTRQWRINWWNSIIDYTVHGKYFWTGKGFGINLAYDDGVEPFPESPTRSPHNGHLTILARAGVPGMVLWAALQLGFGLGMVAGFLRARHAAQHARASLFAWILAYWTAFLVNASFDVYLEGPQAGIWFWCVFAYGIALMGEQHRRREALPRGSRVKVSRIVAAQLQLR